MALAAGIVIVVVIAAAVKFGGLLHAGREELPGATPVQTPERPAATAPVPAVETTIPVTTAPTPSPTPPDPEPYRIFYTGKPLDYPVFRLPENMETFGASDIPWKAPDIVTFAYLEEPRGGLSQVFSVPYILWRMNISVDARIKPQYARFDMVLCYAKDGRVIDGIEILNGGLAFRNVQVSNTDMYIIVHTQNVDRFRINFETPRAYYNQVTQMNISNQITKY